MEIRIVDSTVFPTLQTTSPAPYRRVAPNGDIIGPKTYRHTHQLIETTVRENDEIRRVMRLVRK